ncbi:unnamed protein product [Caenorhabditis angaria]|uniref:F-box domain-containing protein n=1 Tax=Caenorhabditis angaria TaxID=860376 RepID=A0A9P1MU73_9PELO|nr:unnamed protein product [Caenorhabditis angaria]
MTHWSNLPYEMKCEVFKYLNKNDRFRFASCNFQCFREIFHDEKDVTSVELEKITEVGTIRPYFIVSVDGSVIRFEQIANMCEIKYDDYVLARGFGKIENTVYKFFENILLEHRKTVRKLKIADVDFTIFQDFSNIEELEIITNNKIHLYHILSESRNLTKLVVKFFEEAERFEDVISKNNFEWSKIESVDLNCNAADVALEILDIIHSSSSACLKFSINGREFDARLIDVLGRFDTINIDLQLTNDQFFLLVKNKKFELTNFYEYFELEELLLEKLWSSDDSPRFDYRYDRSRNIFIIDDLQKDF